MNDLRSRTLAILTRPGGGRIRTGEVARALGAPRRQVQRVAAELVAEGLVRRIPVANKSGYTDNVFVRPRGGAPSLQASGVNIPPVLEVGIKRPKKKGFWAQLFERAAQIKAERERQREHARRGAA